MYWYHPVLQYQTYYTMAFLPVLMCSLVQVVEMLALACLMHATLTPTHRKAHEVNAAIDFDTEQQYTLHLEFDYSRRDRRQRDYVLESLEHGQVGERVCLANCTE